MPYVNPGNRPLGFLSAAISDSALSLTLGGKAGAAVEGARFGALAAEGFYNLILVDEQYADNDDNWEIVKATAKSTATFTIQRNQESTSPKAFPRLQNGMANKVKVFACTSERILRMIASGGGAVASAVAPSLDLDSPEPILLTPAGAINCDLPTTGVWVGKKFVVINLASAGANVVTVRSSGGNTVCVLPALSSVVAMAVADTPTTAAHWQVMPSFLPDPSWFTQGNSAAWMKMMGAIDVNTTQGAGLAIATVDNPALAALNGTDVAFIDSVNDELRTYRWNGSTWSLVGSGLAIATAGFPALAALNSTDVAFIDGTNDELRCYGWNETTFAQVVQTYDVPAGTLGANNNVLTVFGFGTGAAQPVPAQGSAGVSAMSASGTAWFAKTLIVRTGAAAQKIGYVCRNNRDDNGAADMVRVLTDTDDLNAIYRVGNLAGVTPITGEILLTKLAH